MVTLFVDQFHREPNSKKLIYKYIYHSTVKETYLSRAKSNSRIIYLRVGYYRCPSFNRGFTNRQGYWAHSAFNVTIICIRIVKKLSVLNFSLDNRHYLMMFNFIFSRVFTSLQKEKEMRKFTKIAWHGIGKKPSMPLLKGLSTAWR